VTSQGELQQRRPSRFAVTFADPPGDRIVSDGQWVWVYLPSTNPGQVIRAKVGAEGAGATDFAAQFLEAPRKSYTVSGGSAAAIDGSATHAVVLTPKSTSSPFTKVTLWVNDGDALLRRVETVDQSGVVRRITVTKFARNAPVGCEGVRVQGAGGREGLRRAGELARRPPLVKRAPHLFQPRGVRSRLGGQQQCLARKSTIELEYLGHIRERVQMRANRVDISTRDRTGERRRRAHHARILSSRDEQRAECTTRGVFGHSSGCE